MNLNINCALTTQGKLFNVDTCDGPYYCIQKTHLLSVRPITIDVTKAGAI